jgi:Thrombospondin type 3 repeat
MAMVGVLIYAAPASASDFTVTSSVDDGTDGAAVTLREAITSANAGNTNDRILFAAPVTGTIQLTTALPTLANQGTLEINGPGANVLTVRGEGVTDPYRIFEVANSATVTIAGLAIRDGRTTGSVAAGVQNQGALTLNDVWVRDNTNVSGPGGLGTTSGDTTTINRSLFSGNASSVGAGSAIDASGTTVVRSSTITGNTSSTSNLGAAVVATGGTASLTIENSTVAKNTGTAAGTANIRAAAGTVSGAIKLLSTIVADPLTSTVNCSTGGAGDAFDSQGFNLEDSAATQCGLDQGNDFVNQDPALGALADSGGPTQTLAIPVTSPALDTGDAPAGTNTDQRGVLRPTDLVAATPGDDSDVGAYEVSLEVFRSADAGGGTLRQAITDANTLTGANSITFDSSVTAPVDLLSALPAITGAVTIDGLGADVTTVRRSPSAASNFRIFNIDNSAVSEIAVTLSDMTVSGGVVTGGTTSAFAGGGIRTLETTTLTRVAVSDNSTSSFGGGISLLASDGGSLTITQSLIEGNSAGGAATAGGVDAADGDGVVDPNVTITNSTITGNTATGTSSSGGLTAFNAGAHILIQNSTIAQNTGTTAANLIANNGTVSLRSSIVGDPLGGDPNCAVLSSGTLVSTGFNIDEDNTCNSNQTTDLDVDPQLIALADNGGLTETMAIPSTSAATDGGIAAVGVTTDQRGVPRPTNLANPNAAGGDGTDIGAFEVPQFVVSNSSDAGDGSLRQAIVSSNVVPGTDTITFAPSVTLIQLVGAGPSITDDATITAGARGELLEVRAAAPPSRVFTVGSTASPADVTISGLGITDGVGTNAVGAGILKSAGSSLLLDRVAVFGNSSTLAGGGVFASGPGALTIRNSLIEGNSNSGATSGAGVSSSGAPVVIENSTITGNTAFSTTSAGGLFIGGAATATITNSTIAGNDGGATGAANIIAGGTSTISLGSTLIADPATGEANCLASGGAFNTSGFNLEEGATCNLSSGSNDLINVDPQLSALASNGGPTQTFALPISSPAVDKGKALGGITADQRGNARPDDFGSVANTAGGDGSDIGAFELLSPDDDGDGVADGTDNCPNDANPNQANNDGDANGDVCDSDDDNDGVPDASDACPTQAASTANGCPAAPDDNDPPPAGDKDPPQTTIDKGPKKTTTSTKATIKFSSNEPGSSFECKLDKTPFKPCSSPQRYKKLKPGRHKVSVRAIDMAGNADLTPAAKRWKVKE